MTDLEVPGELLALSTMTLATASLTVSAHAAPVYFATMGLPVSDGFELIFFSAPDSRHGRDLANNPVASAAIYPETFSWQEIRGLQLSGKVRIIEHGTEWDAAWRLFQAKFPFVSELENLVKRNALYAIRPFWIRLVDNRLGFGYKKEWSLDVRR